MNEIILILGHVCASEQRKFHFNKKSGKCEDYITSNCGPGTYNILYNFWNGSHAIPMQWGKVFTKIIMPYYYKLGCIFDNFQFFFLSKNKFALVWMGQAAFVIVFLLMLAPIRAFYFKINRTYILFFASSEICSSVPWRWKQTYYDE